MVAARFDEFSFWRGVSFPEICQRIKQDPYRFKRMFGKCLLYNPVDPYSCLDSGGQHKRMDRLIDPYSNNPDGHQCETCFAKFADARALGAH